MASIEWIVETSDFLPDGERVAQAAEAKGRVVHRVNTDDGFNYKWPRLNNGTPIGYGSNNFILRLARSGHMSEGVFDWHQRLRCSVYYNYVYPGDRIFLPFGALRTAAPMLDEMFGEKVFIRPDCSIKTFTGQVIKTADLSKVHENPELNRAADDMVVLAKVREIGPEYRVFCRDGKAICHSSYTVFKKHQSATKEIIKFAESIAQKLIEPVNNVISVDVSWDKNPVFELLKEMEGNHSSETDYECNLIEINGVNSAGLYGCDLNAFVEMMEIEAIERRNV